MQQVRPYQVTLKNSLMLAPFTSAHTADAIRIWNAASHMDYPINERFLSYNVIPSTGEVIEGRVAIHQEEAVGFVFACVVMNDPSMKLGWVSAIAVHPSAQRQGIGSELLTWAEGWLEEKGCKRIRIGGNLRPFLPGLPSPIRAERRWSSRQRSSVVSRPSGDEAGRGGGGEGVRSFFEKHGYQAPSHQPYEYDIARSLKEYKPLYPKPAHTDLSPMQLGEEHLLLEFLHREYPGRWEFEALEFVKNGRRASDFLLLRVHGEVHGFCRLTLSDSERPIERFYPQRLPQPWGQFGPLGLSKAVRGQGLGGYLIDAAAVHMQSLGVDGCVVDWTSLVELYGKFGFKVYNRYLSLFKNLSS